uniref:Uncharacterized protein n=1 Tax=Anguilla anguilla TaxID=7936 RepID=A0A0E9RD57_ANGAN
MKAIHVLCCRFYVHSNVIVFGALGQCAHRYLIIQQAFGWLQKLQFNRISILHFTIQR